MRIDPQSDRAMQRSLRDRAGRRSPWLKLLSEVLFLCGPNAEFLRHAERPWSSATFSGSRHVIALTFIGREAVARGEEFIAALPDHEFTLPGQLVADATISSVEHENGPEPRMTVEAELLLLDDC
jgi:hypothetical protein